MRDAHVAILEVIRRQPVSLIGLYSSSTAPHRPAGTASVAAGQLAAIHPIVTDIGGGPFSKRRLPAPRSRSWPIADLIVLLRASNVERLVVHQLKEPEGPETRASVPMWTSGHEVPSLMKYFAYR